MRLVKVTLYKLKMMLNDRLFFAAMVIIPLFITIATGYALRYEKLGVVPIALVDQDCSEYSITLTRRLSEKDGFNIRSVANDEAAELLKGNAVEAVFVIKQGFQENIISGNREGIIDMVKSPFSHSAEFVREVVAGEAIRFITDNLAADWVLKQYGKLGLQADEKLRQDVIAYTDGQWEPQPLMTVEYKEMQGGAARQVKKAVMPAATATSTGIIIVFIMFYILFGSSWLVDERINGTLKRLQSGPGALGLSFAANITALLLAGMLQVVIFTAIDRIAFGVDLLPGILAYGVFAVYIVSVISISLFLSSILRTPAQLQAAAPLMALLSGFAGGCFWNFVEMPEKLKLLALFTPQGWALKGINSLLTGPGDIYAALVPSAVLVLFSLILIPLSYIIIRVQAVK